ncbi:MAG TPA: FKBP-type peptidyl-prolyl cis-trans isomerase [Candidatus Scybalocola faecipullorum]|nr:FKBP-type peptidyl-prolyl cis-trans isomerase [Candidatus Scybalocola faecipullorum]
MKIAVTYDNGNVFQHFGRTEFFKVYDVEDNKVVSSEIIGSNGTGHGALAGLLAGQSVDVLICGGIGGGAQEALAQAGVELCAGAQGDTDQAVEAYLKGELVSTGANCDHHHEEGHSCGHHEEGHSCGGHEEGHTCGNCGGGCGPALTGRNVGKTCRVHYRGTLNDGTQFDSSYDRGEPLEFVCGAGQMIQGFDAAVADMEIGQIIDVHLMPEEAYGMPDPTVVFTMEIAQVPGAEDLEEGQRVYLSNQYGQPFPVTVTAKDEKNITFDANHEMAGKELNFRIELVEVK